MIDRTVRFHCLAVAVALACLPAFAPAQGHPLHLWPSDIELVDWHDFEDACGVAVHPLVDQLYVRVYGSAGYGGGIFRIDGVPLAELDELVDMVFLPSGVAFASKYSEDDCVYRVETNGYTRIWAEGFAMAGGLAVAPAAFDGPEVAPGDILMAERSQSYPDQFWAITPDEQYSERTMASVPAGHRFRDLTAAGDDLVYAVDWVSDDVIFELRADGTLTPLVLGYLLRYPVAVEYDDPGGALYVASSTRDLYRVDPVTGAVELLVSDFGGLDDCCLGLDAPSRRLYVADRGGDRVYEFALPAIVAAPDPIPAPATLAVEVYPNPANPRATVAFEVREAGTVRLTVHDARGRLVAVLAERPFAAGSHRLSWDGQDAHGEMVASGSYLVRIESAGETGIAKVTLAR